MGDKNIEVSAQFEHSFTNLLGHASTTEAGIALRQWVNHQGIENFLDLLSWDEDEIKTQPVQQIFSLDDKGQGSHLRTNHVKQICGLITYVKHVYRVYMDEDVRPDPFYLLSPEEWSQQTSIMMRTFLVQNLPNPIGPEPVTSGLIPSSKSTAYSPAALELRSFKKDIKREITAYPSLKDERYFDGFKRSLFIVAKTHECSDVLDPNYTPGSEPEEQELFEAKQTFMFSVFNTNLQTDMGKTIVRRHLASTDAQAVWKELSEHMKTSSKGASEKRRLTQYVTNTVLDDNFKGTTEQFVLHFNEQFRQLEEISEDDERLPPSVKLTLLQTAVRNINDLRIVETLDEFQSTTHGHGSSTSLSYDTYYDLLINLLGHDPTSEPGIALRQWVHFQGVENILDLLSWEEDELKAMPAQQVFSLDDHGQCSYLRTNQTKQICGLITYMKHVVSAYMSEGVRTDPFHPFSPEEWDHQTSTMMRTFLVQNLPNPIGPEPVTSGPIPSSKPTAYSPAALELRSFKKGIVREITAYPSLKDERYFDGFKRSLFIVAKTHECSDVLDPNYTPGSEPEEQELFEAKQTFMFSVFNTNLQTDMGKTIVRRHLASTDAQAVWKELSEHMKTSSKGASEKRRLTQYVTNTVLDDNFKGTTEQFVLHFNEQFRQLEEISEDDERLPPSVKLTLLQTAVRSINDLRIVETLDEFQSTTHGHGSST